jgi:L-fucose mutarotase
MLKTLTRLHTPDLLYALAAMGHGDEIALVDAHFPAVSLARRLIRLDGADLPDATDACLALMPLDSFVDDPALRMEVVGNPAEIPDVQRLCQDVIDRREDRGVRLVGIERHVFYARAQSAFAIVTTGELRPYGCLLFKKGVLAVA